MIMLIDKEMIKKIIVKDRVATRLVSVNMSPLFWV